MSKGIMFSLDDLRAILTGSDAEGAATRGISGSPFIGKYVLVRTYSAGVHVGTLAAKDGRNVLLENARRIWSWSGAFTLSSVATKGITGGKVSVEVPAIELTEAIEIIAVSDIAADTISEFAEGMI